MGYNNSRNSGYNDKGYKGNNYGQNPAQKAYDMSFLNSGYFENPEKTKLREDLIGIWADKVGKDLAYLDPELTTTQIRKFFNEIRSLEARVEDNFDENKALVLMVKSKVAYSAGKKTSKTPKEFKDFIDACIDKVDKKTDFDAFVKFFESVVGYFIYYSQVRENEKREKRRGFR